MKKPCKFGSRRLLRRTLKHFYKAQKIMDASLGLRKTELYAQFFEERAFIVRSGKAPDKETIKILGTIAKSIKEISETKKFQDDFPSFGSFYKFFKKENLSVDDLRNS